MDLNVQQSQEPSEEEQKILLELDHIKIINLKDDRLRVLEIMRKIQEPTLDKVAGAILENPAE